MEVLIGTVVVLYALGMMFSYELWDYIFLGVTVPPKWAKAAFVLLWPVAAILALIMEIILRILARGYK